MGRGGKVSGKGNFRKRARSEEAGSDDSDEDYVISDEDYSSSLDGFLSEESFDSFMEEDDEEFPRVKKFNRSKAKNGAYGQRKNASETSRKRGRITYDEEEEDEEEEEEKEEVEVEVEVEEEEEEEKDEDEDEEEVQEEEEKKEKDEDGEEEIQGRNFNRSNAKNGVCGQPKSASTTSTERGRIAYVEQLEEDEEEVEENKKDKEEEADKKDKEEEKDKDEEEDEEEKVETEGDDEEEEELGDEWKEEEEEEADGEEEDEDFDYDDDDDDDDEFTPEEDDYSDVEEQMRGRKKKNNGMKIGKKVRRASVVSTRGQKKRSSRASKKSLRNKGRKNGGLRRNVKSDDEDDFIDNGLAIRTTSRKKGGRKRRRVLLSDSDCVSSGSSDVEYTISEEEREQVREAKELCVGLRTNLRSSSLLINNEEDGVHEELHQQRKPPGRKGKEKVEEPQGRKGKEKVEDLKTEVVKQVCGICLSEEDKRRVRGVLNCCTHYFCFACIMEWAEVESRCPLCKQRFDAISKPARSTTGIDLREVVIPVPERDQVYQPSEEELRSYIDPYEYIICSECHQGGDDGLMLLCDMCNSPAHTYCVGLGREVPEGNWYCDGCRPVALGSPSSQVQERVAEQRVTIQSLPIRPPAIHVRESIDLNLTSSPRTAFSQGFGHFPSSRFTGRSVEGPSPVSGGGASTLSERRWIRRQIQQLLSMDRMTSTPGRTNAISATTSTSTLNSSQIDQIRETAAEHTTMQDVGTSYHTFFEDRLCNNTSPLMQNGALWPGLVGTPQVLDCEQIHQFNRSNIVIDGSLSPGVREGSNFHIAKEQLQSMVKSHLKSLSQNIDLGHNTFKDIARSSMHTILAACGLEHKKSEVCTVAPPSVCPHIELMAGGQMSLIKGCCSTCFDSFVGDVVRSILDTRISPQWLRLGL